jgi:hypothetical protein
LAIIMFAGVHFHLHEGLAGGIGLVLIVWSIWASYVAQKRAPQAC